MYRDYLRDIYHEMQKLIKTAVGGKLIFVFRKSIIYRSSAFYDNPYMGRNRLRPVRARIIGDVAEVLPGMGIIPHLSISVDFGKRRSASGRANG